MPSNVTVFHQPTAPIAQQGDLWINQTTGQLLVHNGANFRGVIPSALDDELIGIGTGDTARFSWDTTDANANELLLQLPAGGAVDVPVLIIGQAIESVDVGLYNGVTEPRIAMFGTGAVTTGPVVEFRKARGTFTSPTVVTTGDDLGTLDFYGAVAAGEYVRAASIRADMAGTIATTRGPGNLSFNVATDAAPSVMTERVLITASGQINLTPATDLTLADGTGLILGATAQVTVGDPGLAELQVLGTGGADASVVLGRWGANANGPILGMVKSRNATIGSSTIVVDGDTLGTIGWYADDGTDFITAGAFIQAQVDGTPGANDMPTRLIFSTTADGAATVTERMRIAADGAITIADGFPKLTLGTASAFATTQPTNALVMRSGTAPAGAITTAGGLFSSTTVIRKIIADGTASNVET